MEGRRTYSGRIRCDQPGGVQRRGRWHLTRAVPRESGAAMTAHVLTRMSRLLCDYSAYLFGLAALNDFPMLLFLGLERTRLSVSNR